MTIYQVCEFCNSHFAFDLEEIAGFRYCPDCEELVQDFEKVVREATLKSVATEFLRRFARGTAIPGTHAWGATTAEEHLEFWLWLKEKLGMTNTDGG